jgi:hypothetical protein
LVTGLSPWRPGFNTIPEQVGFVVENVGFVVYNVAL